MVSDRIKEIEVKVQAGLAERKAVRDLLRDKKKAQRELLHSLEAIEKAKVFLTEVAMLTQQEAEARVSSIASMALSSVFGNPYEVKLRFVQRRGKSEAELLFTRDGLEFDPMSDTGGGAVETASFALRLSTMLLMRKEQVLAQDEPFRFVSKDHMEALCKMLRCVREDTGIQFILVSHEAELIEAGDKVFRVTQKDGVSAVATVKSTPVQKPTESDGFEEE